MLDYSERQADALFNRAGKFAPATSASYTARISFAEHALAKLPPGLYDRLVSEEFSKELAELTAKQVPLKTENLRSAEAYIYIARHIAEAVAKATESLEDQDDKEDTGRQIELANRLLATIVTFFDEANETSPIGTGDYVTPKLLRSIANSIVKEAPVSPGIPLSQSTLLVNAQGEHRIGAELIKEMKSADRVDLLCSFLKWSGYSRMKDSFRDHLVSRKKQLRIITTAYMGATERRVLDELHKLGAEIRVSYDTRRTRLHAKAWLFHRESKFTTAYIGSSNLSAAAMAEGLEWNVRVSEIDNPNVVKKFGATFDNYWNDSEFENYDPERDGERFDAAIAEEAGEYKDSLAFLNVTPYPFQREILEQLEAQRELHGNYRNLVVAATGTGKTVIAALDYQHQWEKLERPSLLFVAHRKEILQQAQRLFRVVLRDQRFGDMWVGGSTPKQKRHLFASIQTLSSKEIKSFDPTAFDIVIVDEFHHAAADTYQALLEHLKPKILLGLTATPERTDGQDILHWFGGAIAAEIRLWQAIDRGLLAPFQYYGIGDDVDLSGVSWERGGYNAGELDKLYTGNDARVRLVLHAIADRVANPQKMRAIGFCVSKEHAHFMAKKFSEAGLPALAITADTPAAERDAAIGKLRNKTVNVLFAVDLFNEGVDIPEVDTLLMLRPTESSLIFLQQLGRGLRVCEGKSELTVLDFIGNAHQKFRYVDRYRSLMDSGGGSLIRQIENQFPLLPSGCSIQLDQVAAKRVLDNVRNSLQLREAILVSELKRLGPKSSFDEFMDENHIDRNAFYSKQFSWAGLRRECGFDDANVSPFARSIEESLYQVLTFDDPAALQAYADGLQSGIPKLSQLSSLERHRWHMLVASFDRKQIGDAQAFLDGLFRETQVRDELRNLLLWKLSQLNHVVRPLSDARFATVPLAVHGHYSLIQIMAAFDNTKNGAVHPPQTGVYLEKKTKSDLLFVTLTKSSQNYSPNTMYEDYAISPTEFHWQSQNFVTPESETGKRHIDPAASGITQLLFVRQSPKNDFGKTNPYQFLGPVRPKTWSSSRPISIVFGIDVPMPAVTFGESKVANG